MSGYAKSCLLPTLPAMVPAVQRASLSRREPMRRVAISKHTLDQLIRAKMDDLGECHGARPMPVQRRAGAPNGNGCNWMLPGFVGEEAVVRRCQDRMARYLELLRSEFDIADST